MRKGRSVSECSVVGNEPQGPMETTELPLVTGRQPRHGTEKFKTSEESPSVRTERSEKMKNNPKRCLSSYSLKAFETAGPSKL